MQEKKKKTSWPANTNGVALFNKFKVSDAEKWKNKLRQAAKQQQAKNKVAKEHQPTPSTSMASGLNQEEFSRFVSNMIGEGKINPFSLELE